MVTTISSSFILCQHIAKENEEECQEEQYSLCPHCDLWLCSPHQQEHQQMVQTDAHVLNDRVNQIRQQLAELSVEYLYEDCKKKIDHWRNQIYEEIDIRHAEMLQHLTELHTELKEEVEDFQTKTIESFTREIVEPLTHMLTKQKQIHPRRLKTTESWLQSLESKIEEIKEADLIHINCSELRLNGDIHITREYLCDETRTVSDIYETLNLQAVKEKAMRHFPLKTSNAALAASPNFILVFEEPSTLILFDTKTYIRSIDIEEKTVWDICWSDTMKLFLIAGKKLQTYDIISNNLVDTLVNYPQKQSDIWSVTSYFHDILVLYNGGVIERYSWPSFTLRTQWLESIYLEDASDVSAACIRLNSIGMLAMSIKQNDFHWRIDFFDTHMQRTHRGVPLTNNGTADLWDFPFISLNNHEWLVMDLSSVPKMLLFFDKNGQLKQQVESESSNMAQIDENFLVLRKKTGLYLYILPQEASLEL